MTKYQKSWHPRKGSKRDDSIIAGTKLCTSDWAQSNYWESGERVARIAPGVPSGQQVPQCQYNRRWASTPRLSRTWTWAAARRRTARALECQQTRCQSWWMTHQTWSLKFEIRKLKNWFKWNKLLHGSLGHVTFIWGARFLRWLIVNAPNFVNSL